MKYLYLFFPSNSRVLPSTTQLFQYTITRQKSKYHGTCKHSRCWCCYCFRFESVKGHIPPERKQNATRIEYGKQKRAYRISRTIWGYNCDKGLSKIREWARKREDSREEMEEEPNNHPPRGCGLRLRSFISSATSAVGKQKAWDGGSKSREKTPLDVPRISLSFSIFLSISFPPLKEMRPSRSLFSRLFVSVTCWKFLFGTILRSGSLQTFFSNFQRFTRKRPSQRKGGNEKNRNVVRRDKLGNLYHRLDPVA